MIPANLPNPDVASHTGFVTIASETGIVGLLLFLVFLFQLGREAWRDRRDVWVLVPAMLIVPLLMFAQFEGRLIEEPYLWLCLALLYAAMRFRAVRPTPSHTM
jgi:O-antigen ligase